jgi:multiple sugar transport system ATP-binding protein
MTMGDRVAVIDKGVLQQVATPRELYLDPDNVFVAGFMGSPPMNMAEVRLDRRGDDLVALLADATIVIAPELLARKPALVGYAGRTVAMGVRSEDLKECAEHGDWPADRRMAVRVGLVEALGSGVQVHFDVPAPKVRRPGIDEETSTDANTWTAVFGPRSLVGKGETVEIGVDTEQAHFFDLETGLSIRT